MMAVTFGVSKAWIEEEVARLKRAGCQFKVGDVECGADVIVETMTEVRGVWVLVSCTQEEDHHSEVRI